jgi:hypothetical protein
MGFHISSGFLVCDLSPGAMALAPSGLIAKHAYQDGIDTPFQLFGLHFH